MRERPYTIAEAAGELNCSEWLVKQAIKAGQLDAYRINRSIRIDPESVSRLRHGDKRPGLYGLEPRRRAKPGG